MLPGKLMLVLCTVGRVVALLLMRRVASGERGVVGPWEGRLKRGRGELEFGLEFVGEGARPPEGEGVGEEESVWERAGASVRSCRCAYLGVRVCLDWEVR